MLKNKKHKPKTFLKEINMNYKKKKIHLAKATKDCSTFSNARRYKPYFHLCLIFKAKYGLTDYRSGRLSKSILSIFIIVSAIFIIGMHRIFSRQKWHFWFLAKREQRPKIYGALHCQQCSALRFHSPLQLSL